MGLVKNWKWTLAATALTAAAASVLWISYPMNASQNRAFASEGGSYFASASGKLESVSENLAKAYPELSGNSIESPWGNIREARSYMAEADESLDLARQYISSGIEMRIAGSMDVDAAQGILEKVGALDAALESAISSLPADGREYHGGLEQHAIISLHRQIPDIRNSLGGIPETSRRWLSTAGIAGGWALAGLGMLGLLYSGFKETVDRWFAESDSRHGERYGR